MKSTVNGVVGRGIRAQLRPLWPWEDEDTSPSLVFLLGRPLSFLHFGETTSSSFWGDHIFVWRIETTSTFGLSSFWGDY